MAEIAWASAGELARAVRQRRLSPVEIADALLRVSGDPQLVKNETGQLEAKAP